jgi:hypothetical protein
MADNVQNTPVAQSGAAPTPNSGGGSSTPSVPQGGYTDSQSMFADMEKLLGLESEEMPNLTESQSGRAATEEDFLGLGDEEGDGESTDDTAAESIKEDGSSTENRPANEKGNKTDFTKHKFSQEIDGKQYDFDISTPEQLNTIVSKAIVADKVYSNYQALKKETDVLRKDRESLDNIDNMLEKDPHRLLNIFTEDLDDEVVRQWIMAKAEELNQDPQQRDTQKKLKNYAALQAKMDALTEREAALVEDRRKAAMDADRHTVGSWLDGKRSLLGSKVPEKYMSLIEDQMKYVMMEARDKTRRKEVVTVKTLDAMLNLKIKPILELISQDKPTRNVDREVGQATQSKKEQNLSRIQSSTSQRQPAANQTGMKRLIADQDNPVGIFEEVLKGMDQGRLKLRKG